MKLFYTDEDLEKKNKRKAIKDTLTELRDSIPWPRFLPILQNVFRGKTLQGHKLGHLNAFVSWCHG